MKRFLLTFAALTALSTISARISTSLNSGWTLQIADSIVPVDLPHTWNALDGQDGGNDYYRGPGRYSAVIDVPALDGKTAYLNFAGANMTTKVCIDGQEVGSHTGGHARFIFDITPYLRGKKQARLDVTVDDSESIIAPPLGGDFTFFGGITRDLQLDVLPDVHIAPVERVESPRLLHPIDVASPGVRIAPVKVGADEAVYDVTVAVRNASSESVTRQIAVEVRDNEGRKVAEDATTVTLEPGTTTHARLRIRIDAPKLWNGKSDAYLYSLTATLGDDDDAVTQPLGVRYYEVTKDAGLTLNGRPYRLRGIAMHDAVNDKGRAVSDDDRRADIDLMLGTGANYLRLSHYQHGDFTYAYLDTLGIVCWTEVPVVEQTAATHEQTPEFIHNSTSQLYELIYQLQNHPSVFFWGLANETRQKPGVDQAEVVTHLNEVAHELDPSRPTTMAHNGWYDECKITDLVAFNIYNGWYGGTIDDFGRSVDYYNSVAAQPVAVSEYGAGANIHQHELPARKPDQPGGDWHPEEYQNAYHEGHLAAIEARPWLWETSIWVGIDFASDWRAEGLQPGINDKGLVTFDRRTLKDAYYLYRAAWNTDEPTLYITGRRYSPRKDSRQTIRIYTNCPAAALQVNGKLVGAKARDGYVVEFENVELERGDNVITATAVAAGPTITDTIRLTIE